MLDSKKHLDVYSDEEINIIKKRWNNTITIFNDNLAMTNYSVILLRKNICDEEPEIFLTEEV